MLNQIIRLLKEEDGQGMVEYGIILALVSVVAIGILTQLGGKVDKTFTEVDRAMDGVANGGNGGGGGQ